MNVDSVKHTEIVKSLKGEPASGQYDNSVNPTSEVADISDNTEASSLFLLPSMSSFRLNLLLYLI